MDETLPIASRDGDRLLCPHCRAAYPVQKVLHLNGRKTSCAKCKGKFRIEIPGVAVPVGAGVGSASSTAPVDDPETLFSFSATPTPSTPLSDEAAVRTAAGAPEVSSKRPSVAQAALRRAAGSLVGMRLGQVDVTGAIGKGGMGVVYRGHHVDLDIEVAVKVLPDDLAGDTQLIQRFLREARLAVKLNHSNIVRVYNVAQQDGLYYLVMELVEGEDAAHILRAGGRFGYRRSLEIGIASARALEAAHHEGLVHRDMKPHNILLSRDRRIKISDFGLARAAGSRSGLTVSGQVMGTPHYMSPEQAETLPVDHRSDIYSLGVTLYHLLTGHPPFSGDTPIAVALAHVRCDVPFPEDVFGQFPEGLVPVLAHMCARDRDARYNDAGTVANDLEALLAAAPIEDNPTAILPALLTQGRKVDTARLPTSAAATTGTLPAAAAGRPASGSNSQVRAGATGQKSFALKVVIVGLVLAALAGGGVLLYGQLNKEEPPVNTAGTNSGTQTQNPENGTTPHNPANVTQPTTQTEPNAEAIRKLLQTAQDALDSGDPEIAEHHLEAAAMLADPKGVFASQIDQMRKAVEPKKTGKQARKQIMEYLKKAREAEAAGDYDLADEYLQNAEKLGESIKNEQEPELHKKMGEDSKDIRRKAREWTDKYVTTQLTLAAQRAQAGEFSAALDILSRLEKMRRLPEGTADRISSARAAANTQMAKHFDQILSRADAAITAGNVDEATTTLEQCEKLELDAPQRARLAAMQARIPQRQKHIVMRGHLADARRCIGRRDLSAAQTALAKVERGANADIDRDANALAAVLKAAEQFTTALVALDLATAATCVETVREGVKPDTVEAYETLLADVRRQRDRFETALSGKDIADADAAVLALEKQGVGVVGLRTRLDAARPRPMSDMERIAAGRWYDVERRLRLASPEWQPDSDKLPPGASRDTVESLRQVGTEMLSRRGTDLCISTALSPNGQQAAIARSGGWVDICTSENLAGKPVTSISLDGKDPLRVRYTIDGKYIIIAADGGGLQCRDVATFKPAHTYACKDKDGDTVNASDLALSQDGAVMVAGLDNGTICFFSLPTLTPCFTPLALGEPVTAVAISASAGIVFAGGNKGNVTAWSYKTGERLGVVDVPKNAVGDIAASPDGKTFALALRTSLYTVDAQSRAVLHECDRICAEPINVLTYAPDGATIVFGDNQRSIRVVDANTGKVIRTLNAHARSIRDICFDEKGTHLLSCATDRISVLWKFWGAPGGGGR